MNIIGTKKKDTNIAHGAYREKYSYWEYRQKDQGACKIKRVRENTEQFL